MRLIETLRASIAQDDSPFRAQLMREDIDRLNDLRNAVSQAKNRDSLRRAAMDAGWTASPSRTEELRSEIEALSDAVYELATAAQPDDAMQAAVEQRWLALHRLRLERMVGCLSTPLPRPQD